ncbi:type II toxin-antitoxin system HicB family antitoxin [Ancylobacter lacus]|uniref:type II toxin-antitoxin system HicB family antitoxin n=1 Tax=Ancylobacter lacus TaxID=2579970 RepID=UPI0031B86A26
MTHYIAIVEDAGPTTAAGAWFPDLPGCFSAGDDLDEALRNAAEAVALSPMRSRRRAVHCRHPAALPRCGTTQMSPPICATTSWRSSHSKPDGLPSSNDTAMVRLAFCGVLA